VGGPHTVYVALLAEGTDVWRPASADQVGPEFFRLTGQVPDGESWEFRPGEVVRCVEHTFTGGVRGLLAVERAVTEPKTTTELGQSPS
jgi:hypothetical protein